MGRYCVVCGQIKGEDGMCHNPRCRSNHREADPTPREPVAPKRPIRLTDRIKELRSPEQGSKEISYEPLEEIEDPFFHEEAAEPKEEAPFFHEETPEPEEEWGYRVPWGEPEAPPAPTGEETGAYSRRTDLRRWMESRREHMADPVVGENLPGIVTVIASVLFSGIGTLLFGLLYLEDFLMRWAVVTLVPVVAYGFSFLYGWLILLLGRGERNSSGMGSELSRLFRQVASAGKLPNRLLLLTAILSTFDKSLRIFQFFALLLVLTWLVSLLFHILGEYRSCCNGRTLLLTIVFAFLAFTAMRATWVWYLTGDFRFALHIPLNIFF